MNNNALFTHENPLFEKLYDVLKESPKRIVFTDGEDIRVLQAAEELAKLEIIVPILLGDRKRVLAIAKEAEISMNFINVIDPASCSDSSLFQKRLEKIEKYRGKKVANTADIIRNPHNFAAMMVQYGQADGMVAGNRSHPTSIFRAVGNFIKPIPGVTSLFSVVMLYGPHLQHMGSEGVLFMADCGMTPNPTVDELASFGVEAGKLASQFLSKEVKVAFLSHSTKGSMVTDSSRKMEAATAMAKNSVAKQSLAMTILGEVQADVALDPVAAEVKNSLMGSESADVIVFPNLDAAHISFKLLQHVGGAQHYGQLILGLTKPAAQVPMTTSVETLMGTAVLVGVEAAKGREMLYAW